MVGFVLVDTRSRERDRGAVPVDAKPVWKWRDRFWAEDEAAQVGASKPAKSPAPALAAATIGRKGSGVRSASLILAAGHRYRFGYLRDDGMWFNGEADAYLPNDYGEEDGILDLDCTTPTEKGGGSSNQL